MIPGGISDKLGNSYESDWTLCATLRVIQGTADAIRLEPFNEEADGFEFWLETSGIREWHQCKSRRSTGTWTMGALTSEGVLAAFAEKLSTSDAVCVFVSSDAVSPFKTIVGKARLAANPTDFADALNEDETKAMVMLRKAWGVLPDLEHDWLRRCRVEITSDDSLQRQLESYCGLLFRDAPKTVAALLKGHLEKRLTHRLTTDDLREAAGTELKLQWRAELDPTIDGLISEATDSYQRSLRTTIAGVRIQTPDDDIAKASALFGNQKNLVVAGQAGSGKSSAIDGLIDGARCAGWPVLAFRMDRLLACKTVEEIGQVVLGRDANPVGALGNRNRGKPCLIVIDQVDAVSDASGRAAPARELLFKMVDAACLYPEMKVVLACRTFDLDNDYNLRRLSKAETSTTLKLSQLDWEMSVVPILSAIGLADRPFSDEEKQILSLPLNLYLFAEVVVAGAAVPNDLSTGRLIDALIEVRAREFRAEQLPWTPLGALGAMAEFMSQHQELIAPEAVLARFPGAVGHLRSAGLISGEGGKLQFAHESFFDHVFAAHFLGLGTKVVDLLLADEQRLFRRTQMRQIFARLRDQGVGRRYLQELTAVTENAAVRYLVKDAVGAWLTSVENPTPEELRIVLDWFKPGHPLKNIARSVLHGRHWCSLLAEAGTVGVWLSGDEEHHSLAMWLLRQNASLNPSAVAAILRQHLAAQPAFATELLAWFGELYVDGNVGELEELYGELVETAPPEVFTEERLPRIMGLSSWTHGDAARGARVLGRWLRRWFALFEDGDPFERIQASGDDGHWVREMVEIAPAAFADAVIPSFAEAVLREHVALEAGTLHYSELATLELDDEYDLPPRSYTTLVRNALRKIAANNPDHARRLLDMLPREAKLSLHLEFETIAASPTLADRLPPLLANRHLLVSRYHAALWWSFADAAKAAMLRLSPGDRLSVEGLVLGHQPELDYIRRSLHPAPEDPPPTAEDRKRVMYYLAEAGSTERAIFKTIGREHLSEATQRRLDELERKFRGQAPPKRHSGGGGMVRSPISGEIATRMADRHWRKAMERYRDDSGHVFHRRHVIGGCRELASVLRGETTKDPERFVNLLEQLPQTLNPAYAEAILGGLHNSKAAPDVVERAMLVGLTWPRRGFDRTICWAAQEHPEVGRNPEIVAFLIDVAENGEASDTAVRTVHPAGREEPTPTVRDLLGGERDIESSGINGDRGSAYQALGAILWDREETIDVILPFLERQIDVEPLPSVRSCIARVINAVAKQEPVKAIELFLRLAARDLSVVRAHNSGHFLNWAVYNHSDALMPLILTLIGQDDEHLRAQGLFHLSGIALSDEAAEATLLSYAEHDVLARRVIAFRGSGNIGAEGFGKRAEGWVRPLLSDPNKLVRDEASHCSWDKLLDGSQTHTAFLTAYIASMTFAEHADRLMMVLGDKIDVYPDLAIQSVERVVALLDGWQKDRQRGHFSVTHRLGKVLINLYRAIESDPAKEEKILDLFDAYLAHDLYNLRQEIAAYERH